jgi:hypothetical protein
LSASVTVLSVSPGIESDLCSGEGVLRGTGSPKCPFWKNLCTVPRWGRTDGMGAAITPYYTTTAVGVGEDSALGFNALLYHQAYL